LMRKRDVQFISVKQDKLQQEQRISV
ncbi:Fe-S cluster assembly transcriptional regulator IscR, partial [Shewanella sp. GutDb-MelDb]